jgi:hypothetical protein
MRGRQCSVAVMPWRRSVLRVGERGARLRDHILVSLHPRPVVAIFNRHTRRFGLNRVPPRVQVPALILVSGWRQAVHPIAFNTAIARRQDSDVRHPSVSSRCSTAMHRLRQGSLRDSPEKIENNGGSDVCAEDCPYKVVSTNGVTKSSHAPLIRSFARPHWRVVASQ